MAAACTAQCCKLVLWFGAPEVYRQHILNVQSLTCAAEADCPCVNILWITPHQIAEGALMRDLADTLNRAHLWGSREALLEVTKHM